MLWRMEADLRGLPPLQDASLDKRPKLERAHSAAEKENHPLQRTGSALRRQYSQQEPRCYGELEGLARTHPHLVHPRQKAAYGVEDNLVPPATAQLMALAPHPPMPPRSSSSDDEVPECVSDENDEYRDRGKYAHRPFFLSPLLPSIPLRSRLLELILVHTLHTLYTTHIVVTININIVVLVGSA